MIADLLALPQYAPLITQHIARVLVAEAVDCYARNESSAQHWLVSALVISSALEDSLALQRPCRIPAKLRRLIADAEEDLQTALWRCTSCGCLDAPNRPLPWSHAMAQVEALVGVGEWQRAISSSQQVLGLLAEHP